MDEPDHTPTDGGNTSDLRSYLCLADVGRDHRNHRPRNRWAQPSSVRRAGETHPTGRPFHGSLAGHPRHLSRDMFRDTQLPPGTPECIPRDEVVDDGIRNNTTTPLARTSDQQAEPRGGGTYAPRRFRDIEIEFNHNVVEDISGGARVATGFRAGRDLRARIHHNTFGRMGNSDT